MLNARINFREHFYTIKHITKVTQERLGLGEYIIEYHVSAHHRVSTHLPYFHIKENPLSTIHMVSAHLYAESTLIEF